MNRLIVLLPFLMSLSGFGQEAKWMDWKNTNHYTLTNSNQLLKYFKDYTRISIPFRKIIEKQQEKGYKLLQTSSQGLYFSKNVFNNDDKIEVVMFLNFLNPKTYEFNSLKNETCPK